MGIRDDDDFWDGQDRAAMRALFLLVWVSAGLVLFAYLLVTVVW